MPKHFPHREQALRDRLRVAARQMRHEATPAEELLWQRLRNRRLAGARFHRQYRIDRYIVDFYCAQAALVIEVDGEVHSQQVEADAEREQRITDLGFHVLRFSNAQVLNAIDDVIIRILNSLEVTPSPKSGFDGFGEGAGDEDHDHCERFPYR